VFGMSHQLQVKNNMQQQQTFKVVGDPYKVTMIPHCPLHAPFLGGNLSIIHPSATSDLHDL